MYFLFLYLGKSRIINRSFTRAYDRTKEGEKLRSARERRKRFVEGNQEKINFLYRLDLLLLQSNCKRIFPFVNSEIFLIIMLSLSALGFVIADILSQSYILGIICSLFIILLFYLVLYIISGIHYKRTENEILTFINLLENYSKTSDDLISIFGRLFYYLEEPLKSAVEDCYIEGRSTGDLSFALSNLSNRIEHQKFKEVIRNLEICARHEANYGEIVNDSRGLLRDFIASQKERKAIIQNGRIEILIIMACSIIMVGMLNGFMERGLWQVLLQTLLGNFIILYCVAVLCACVITMVKFDKNR